AYAEPLSCALHAVERAEILFDDVVVIAGAGPIGLGATIGAAHKSPKLLVVLDFDDDKLALAEKCGADLTLNLSQVDVQQEIRDLTGGYGADVYIECTGHPSAVPQGLNLLRKLGRFVEYSVFKENVSVDWSIISDDKELDVRGAHLGPHTWPGAIKIIEKGDLPLDDICTHQFGLADFQKALDSVADSAGASATVSIVPGLGHPCGTAARARGPDPRPVGRPAPLLRLPAHRSADMSTASTTSTGGPTVPAAGSVHET